MQILTTLSGLSQSLPLLTLLLLLCSTTVSGFGSMGPISAAFGQNGFFCAIDASGKQNVVCWGKNSSSSSPSSSSSDSAYFNNIPAMAGLSGGEGFLCGILANTSQAYCWSSTSSGTWVCFFKSSMTGLMFVMIAWMYKQANIAIPTDRLSLAKTMGPVAASHLDLYFDKLKDILDNVGQSIFQRFLSSFTDSLRAEESDDILAALVLMYGYAAKYAPSTVIEARRDALVGTNMLSRLLHVHHPTANQAVNTAINLQVFGYPSSAAYCTSYPLSVAYCIGKCGKS